MLPQNQLLLASEREVLKNDLASAASYVEMVNISQKNTNLLLFSLRYFLNPNYSIFYLTPLSITPIPSIPRSSPPIHPFSSSTVSPSNSSITPPFCIYPNSIALSRLNSKYTVLPSNFCRWFSVSSLDSASLESAIYDTIVNQVVEVISSNGDDCNSKLNSTGLILSVKSIFKVFQGLNSERVPGLSFYKWVRYKNPNLSWNAHVCSLMIDNCGQVGDYDTMTYLLKEFKGKRICLTDKAFEFLTMCVSLSEVEGMVMIRVLVGVLNEVGGSCRGSGICAMIKILCTLDLFEMAKFVMELTERSVSYYNILMADRCKRHHFEEARGLLEEMRGVGCEMEAGTYNYMLGSLCKSGRMYEACSVLEEMLGNNTPPTAITFEIFICYLCRIGKLDITSQFYSQMMSRGLEVRITTHAAFLEGYFKAGKYEEAHRYVQAVGVGVPSSNMVYSLLAKLHQKKGDLVIAQRVLIDMMDKGLKPYFPIYMDIIKGLKKNRRRHLADDLKRGFSRFYVESRMKTG